MQKLAKLLTLAFILSALNDFSPDLIASSGDSNKPAPRNRRALFADAKRLVLPECHETEPCAKLTPAHYVLYSRLKQALDSDFDLSNGKELVEVFRAYRVLSIRFENELKSNSLDNKDSNHESISGSSLVVELLQSPKVQILNAMTHQPELMSLIDIYRSSTGGKKRNFACSEQRIDDIKRAIRMIESNSLRSLFGKLHDNWVKRSARRCLKHSCTGLDLAMSNIDSFVKLASKKDTASSSASSTTTSIPSTSSSTQTTVNSEIDTNNIQSTKDKREREFGEQEFALCRFFKNSTSSSVLEPNCKISSTELSEISLIDGKTEVSQQYKDLLSIYVNKLEQVSNLNDSSMDVLTKDSDKVEKDTEDELRRQCAIMSPLLKYNLNPIYWYRDNKLFGLQKLETRQFWCPLMAYWIQIDRLCDELEVVNKLKDKQTISPIETLKQQEQTTKSQQNLNNNINKYDILDSIEGVAV